jgi:hypothetical protein
MPQRMGSPFQFGQAVLEPIVQPLYDSESIAAATGATRFFITTAGKGEQFIYSGITGGGQLSAPRMFVIYGIRLVWSESVTPDTAVLSDLKTLLYASWFRLRVGVKNYIEVPSHYLPAGVGIAGFAATTVAGTSFQTATSGVPAFFSRMSIEKRRIAIPPQQSFFGELNVTTAAVNARRLWVYLDGEFGQEVQ